MPAGSWCGASIEILSISREKKDLILAADTCPQPQTAERLPCFFREGHQAGNLRVFNGLWRPVSALQSISSQLSGDGGRHSDDDIKLFGGRFLDPCGTTPTLPSPAWLALAHARVLAAKPFGDPESRTK